MGAASTATTALSKPSSLAAISWARALSTSASRLDADAEALASQPGNVGAPDAAVLSSEHGSEEPEEGEALPTITNEFRSLKGSIAYPTFKALTVRPFGYEEMSDVQFEVLKLLPHLSDPHMGAIPDGQGGRDMLVKARTGTGKTIAFLVPAIETRLRAIHAAERGIFTESWREMLERNRPGLVFEDLDKHGRQLVARQFAHNTVGTLILSPTRELATQIASEAEKLHTHHKQLGVQLLVGGASRQQQIREWRRGRPDIVVATPGRILDLIKSEPMVADALSAMQTLIFDEADTLLDMGFKNEIERIVEQLPEKTKRNTMLFSATVSQDIRKIARQTLERDHRFIDCVPPGEENVHKHIPQAAHIVEPSDQIVHAARLIALDQLQNPGKSKVIVFAPTTNFTVMLNKVFKQSTFQETLPCGTGSHIYELHSQLDQNKRFRVSDMFRKDACGASVLVTTDVSARGVDYPGVTRVIQVGAPISQDQYIHRIGRTGRAGAQGRADLVLMPYEAGFLHTLQDMPVSETSAEETQAEIERLCKSFDEDPSSIIDASTMSLMKAGSRKPPQDRKHNKQSTPRVSAFLGPLFDRITVQLPDNAREATEHVDEELRAQTFTSQLGYYVGRAQDMRQSKMGIVQGLKEWAVSTALLEKEPYVSAALLEKMGVNRREQSGGGGYRDRNGGRFGNSRGGGGRSGGDSWGSRGSRSRTESGSGSFRDRGSQYDKSVQRGKDYDWNSYSTPATPRRAWDDGVRSARGRVMRANSRGGPNDKTHFHA